MTCNVPWFSVINCEFSMYSFFIYFHSIVKVSKNFYNLMMPFFFPERCSPEALSPEAPVHEEHQHQEAVSMLSVAADSSSDVSGMTNDDQFTDSTSGRNLIIFVLWAF